MAENIVLELLKTTVEIEIENGFVIKDDCIEIKLPNDEIAILKATFVGTIGDSNNFVRVNDYVYKHDYGEIGETRQNKLLLRSLQDVEDYAIDVSQINIVDVRIIGNFVISPYGTIVQIIVDSKK